MSKIISVDISKHQDKALVCHSNKLTEARYFLTVGEQKIILLLISLISPDDENFKNYELKISDFSTLMGVSSHNVYDWVEDILDKLLSRVIHIPKNNGFLKIGWISSAEYFDGEGIIQLSFDKKLKPYLLKLKSEFTKYRLSTISQFKSSYSIRIYMLLKQYETIGHREFSLLNLKEVLGIENSKYPQFKEFKRRVINQAKKEFEVKDKETGCYKSDITFDLETIKTGRRITRLRFIIKKQKIHSNRKNPAEILINPIEKETETPAQKALAYYGITGATAKKYLAEQTEVEILRTIELLEARKNNKDKDAIGNVKSYLVKLLNAQAGKKSPAELEAEEEAKRKEALKKEQQRKKREAKKREEALKKCERDIRKAFLATLSEEEKSNILEEIKQENPAISNFINSIEQGAGLAFLGSYIPDYEAKKQACLERYLTT